MSKTKGKTQRGFANFIGETIKRIINYVLGIHIVIFCDRIHCLSPLHFMHHPGYR